LAGLAQLPTLNYGPARMTQADNQMLDCNLEAMMTILACISLRRTLTSVFRFNVNEICSHGHNAMAVSQAINSVEIVRAPRRGRRRALCSCSV
jgi:phosphoheptose isomerase